LEMMEKARRKALSTAGFVLICFFLPWVQVSSLGTKDLASGFNLARRGDRALWLVPLLMIMVLAVGLMRAVWIKYQRSSRSARWQAVASAPG
jgi:hypothetical protein